MGRARAASDPASADERALRGLIRRSRVLDPVLKRAWLAVLPQMAERHRLELREILLLEHDPASEARRADRGGTTDSSADGA